MTETAQNHAPSTEPGSVEMSLRSMSLADLVQVCKNPGEPAEVRARILKSPLGERFTTQDLLDAGMFDLALFSSQAQPELDSAWRSAALSYGMMAVAGCPKDTPHGSLQCVHDLMRMLAHHYAGSVPNGAVQAAIDAVNESPAVKMFSSWAGTQSHVMATAGVTTLNMLVCLCTQPSHENLLTISSMSRMACACWKIHEHMMEQGVGDLSDEDIERKVHEVMPPIEAEQIDIFRRVLGEVARPQPDMKAVTA